MNRQKRVSSLEDHLGYWLRFVSNHISHGFTHKVEARGVTVAEWVLLRELFDARAANPSQLAEKLGMTRGAISKLVERVCQKQLAERVTSDVDRRFQSVSLTPAGKKLVPELALLADENDREFFGHLEPADKRWLFDLLKDIVYQHGWKDAPVD